MHYGKAILTAASLRGYDSCMDQSVAPISAPTLLGRGGHTPLPEAVQIGAERLAAQDYAACVAEDFSGDWVRDLAYPGWLGDVALIFPVSELARMGLEPVQDAHHVYATCSVDSHVDDMDGLSVCVVLHSDGFTFRQGKVRLRLNAGDWFIFDDRLAHHVKEDRKATSLIILTAPLRNC